MINSCQFYLYRKDTYLCTIYDQGFEISDCHVTAGPHEPTITSCKVPKMLVASGEAEGAMENSEVLDLTDNSLSCQNLAPMTKVIIGGTGALVD